MLSNCLSLELQCENLCKIPDCKIMYLLLTVEGTLICYEVLTHARQL